MPWVHVISALDIQIMNLRPDEPSDKSLTSPANNPNVLTVSVIADRAGVCGAAGPMLVLSETLADDSFVFFSNIGPVVKIAAPGVIVLSTYTDNGYTVDSRTSMAAPYVT